MKDKILFNRLIKLINEDKIHEFREEITQINEVDMAEFMMELDFKNLFFVFRILPKDLAANIFAFLDVEQQEHIINSITDVEIENIVKRLYVDDVVDIIEELPANLVKRVLENTTHDTRKVINEFLKYPENSAGSVMTVEYIGLKKNYNVEEAFNFIRKHGVDKETIYNCYVMDNDRKLIGVVTVKDLLMNKYETIIEDIMHKNFIKTTTIQDREEVVELFNKYDLISLPVVDTEDRLVGIITVDDVVDVMEQEATEDFEKMAAMLPSEKPYLKTSVLTLSKNRIPWLLILMFSSMLTGQILSKYEKAFEVLPLLVTFIPMLTDTGGNAGSQSSTMIIRGMAIGELKISDSIKVLWKEMRVGFICGLVLAIFNFIRLIFQYPNQYIMAFTVVISLFATVMLAKIIGGLLPLFAKAVKLDPAIMAAPLITTIVDALSLVLYFQVAVELLKI